MSKLTPTTPLKGASHEFNDLTIKEKTRFEIVSLAIASGEELKFGKSFKKAYGSTLPAPGTWEALKTGQILWTGQNQYFLFQDCLDDRLDEKLGKTFEGLAYATLQTDGWAALEVHGPDVHDVFDRFIQLDLRRQAIGFGARSSAHHMSVMVLKTGDDAYLLLTPRSSSAAFLEALVETAHNSTI